MSYLRSCLLFLLLAAVLLSGCDLLDGNDEPAIDTPASVVVANGGNFGDQNGFLTVYDPLTKQATNLADLGAFAQSLALNNGVAYVPLNTFSTGRVAVIDLQTNQQVGQIENIPLPRYIAFANGQKAYVTNTIYGGNGLVSVIDLTTRSTVGDPVEVGISPEGILVVEDRVFVANYGASGDGTALSVIDTGSDAVVGTIELGCDGPKQIFLDNDGELAVVCQGKTLYNEEFTEILEQTNGQIVFVDPESETVVDRIAFDQQVGSANFTQTAYYADAAEELYVLDGADGVYRINTAANTLADVIIVPEANDLVGATAVAYDAATEDLYVGRFARGVGGGPDYTAAGAVVILDRAGTQLDRFTAGPSPAHIELRHED